MPEQPQHLRAMAKANAIRRQRTLLRNEVRRTTSPREARSLLAAMLEDDRLLPALGTLRVDTVLRWKGLFITPTARLARQALLDEAGCSEFVTVRQLTVRQLDVLAAALRRPDPDVAREAAA